MRKLLAILMVVGFAGAAFAAPVGVGLNIHRSQALADSDTAGVFAQQHWNNTGSRQKVGTLTDVIDSDNVASSVDISWTLGRDWTYFDNYIENDPMIAASVKPVDTGDEKLLSSNFSIKGGSGYNITASDLDATFDTYDVHVYVAAVWNPPSAQMTLVSDGGFSQTRNYESVGYQTPDFYDTHFDGSTVGGAYGYSSVVTFSGVTGNSFTVTTNGSSDYVGAAGIQIVGEPAGGGGAIPEPATMALVALGALGLVIRRK